MKTRIDSRFDRLKTQVDTRFMDDPQPYMPHGRKGPSGVWPWLRSNLRETGHPFTDTDTTHLCIWEPGQKIQEEVVLEDDFEDYCDSC